MDDGPDEDEGTEKVGVDKSTEERAEILAVNRVFCNDCER